MTVFVLGALFGRQLTLHDLEPTPTMPSEISAILILKDDILNIKTGQPVVGDVLVHDRCVRGNVTQVDLMVRMATDRLTESCAEVGSYLSLREEVARSSE
jgi:hypothetical protein